MRATATIVAGKKPKRKSFLLTFAGTLGRLLAMRALHPLAPWLLPAVAAFAAGSACALEYPIGKPQIRAGMEVAAVYLQPVAMEPTGMMRDAKASDIHLEADIKATDKNANGFADGTWIPYLSIQ